MADDSSKSNPQNTIRYPDFDLEKKFENSFFVGYKQSDKKERRFSFEDILTFLGFSDYSDEKIQEWLGQGFTWLDIGVFLLQRQNIKRDIAEPFIFARLPSEEVEKVVKYIKTPQGFVQTGIAACDGNPFPDNSGSSWQIKDRFIRGWAPEILHERLYVHPYETQEDALQEHEHNTYYNVYHTSVGPASDPYMIYGRVRQLKTEGVFGARVSSETRPKGIYFPYFQVVKKLPFSIIGDENPTKLL